MTSSVSTPLRAGVIGAGVFGGYHSGKYADHADTDLVAIFDLDAERARALADKHGAEALTDLSAFLDRVDVVTIASPGFTHGEMARKVLEAGKPVLVEKPLALTAKEAADLAHLAEDKGLVLACGHQERLVFNAMGLTALDATPRKIKATRQGAFNVRGTDVSVTFDLMVHDLDLALTLIGQTEPESLTVKARKERSDFFDDVTMYATFENGAELELHATRIAEGRHRTMRVEYETGVIDIDFIARSFENTTGFDLNADYLETPEGKDPLGANVSAFLDAVLERVPAPAVTGQAGAAAVAMAELIDAAVA